MSHQAQQFGAKARPWAPLVLFAVLIGFPAVERVVLRPRVHACSTRSAATSAAASVGWDNFMFWRG